MTTERNLEIAADWLQRLDDPQLNEDDLQSWLKWFDASDANRGAFEELQALCRNFRKLPEDQRDELKRRVRVAVFKDSAADAVAGDFRNRLGIPLRPSEACALQGGNRTRRSFAWAASIGTFTLGLGAWLILQTSTTEAIYTAPVDHHRMVTLQDGSSLVLGANAIVAVSYSPSRRALNVQRGEAYFEVRRDPGRPFVVHAGSISVTALGTAFNVQRRQGKVAVLVTQGRVAVKDEKSKKTAKKIYLAVGQRAVLAIEKPIPAAAAPKTGKTTGWQNGRAEFINTPLNQILPMINRYASAKLVIGDPRVGDLTYSGTILRDHLDEWVESLPQVYPIRAVPLQDGTLTLVSNGFEGQRISP